MTTYNSVYTGDHHSYCIATVWVLWHHCFIAMTSVTVVCFDGSKHSGCDAPLMRANTISNCDAQKY